MTCVDVREPSYSKKQVVRVSHVCCYINFNIYVYVYTVHIRKYVNYTYIHTVYVHFLYVFLFVAYKLISVGIVQSW